MKGLFRRIDRNKNLKPELLADLERFLSEELAAEDYDLYEDAELSVEPELSDHSERSEGLIEEDNADLPDEVNYYPQKTYSSRSFSAPQAPASDSFEGNAVFSSIEDVFGGLGETFQEKLLKMIDEKGLTDAQVYTKANLDRRLFSKIRCNVNYKPSKSTALALAIALGLDLDETTDLLGRAGLALSPSSKADLIVKYCIMNRIYDILDVNALLYEYDQQLLGY